jgi:hypothetical protein
MICLHVPYFFVNLGDLKYTTYTVKDYWLICSFESLFRVRIKGYEVWG